MSVGYSPGFRMTVICQEPDGVPAHRFVTDLGFLPASVPGVSGSKIFGISEYAAQFGEAITVITSGSGLVTADDVAGIYRTNTIANTPPVSSVTVTDNGSFVTASAEGKAIASTTASASDVGFVAPGSYAKLADDLIEVILQ